MIVYLLGFMGSGKSTVGRKLANKIGMRFIDLDAAIESQEGKTINEIFSKEGEAYFRTLETEVLRSKISSPGNLVSCGGGTPCYNENMDYMNSTGKTVYIEMTAAALLSRLKNSRKTRPLIAELTDEELAGYISNTLNEREIWYKKAGITINGLDPDITQLSYLLQAPDSYNP